MGVWVFLPIGFIIFGFIQSVDGAGCGFPGSPSNGTVSLSGSEFPVNTTVQYGCNPGYILFGDSERTCKDNAVWSGDIPMCDLNIALNKRATQSETYQQLTASLAVDGKLDTCAFTPKVSTQRWWQINLGRTYNVAAVAITITTGVRHKFSIFVVTTEFNKNILYKLCAAFDGTFGQATEVFECNDGQGQIGEYVLLRDDRAGTVHLGLCEVEVFALRDNNPCGHPELPVHSQASKVTAQRVEYACASGYRIEGNSVLQCNDGQWEGPPPKCTVVTCFPPLSIPHGELSVTHRPANGWNLYSAGSVANYTCHEGYRLESGSKSNSQEVDNSSNSVRELPLSQQWFIRTCGNDGNWSGPEPYCSPLSCGLPAALGNGSVHYLNQSFPTHVGSAVEYICNDGYEIEGEGPFLSYCQPDMKWAPVKAFCNGTMINDLTAWRAGLVQSMVIGIVVPIVLIILLVVALLYARHHGCDKIRNKITSKSNSSLVRNNSPPSGVNGGGSLSSSETSSSSNSCGFIPARLTLPFTACIKQKKSDDPEPIYDDVYLSTGDVSAKSSPPMMVSNIPVVNYATERTPSESTLPAYYESSDPLYDDTGTELDIEGFRIYDQPEGGGNEDPIYYSPTPTTLSYPASPSPDIPNLTKESKLKISGRSTISPSIAASIARLSKSSGQNMFSLSKNENQNKDGSHYESLLNRPGLDTDGSISAEILAMYAKVDMEKKRKGREDGASSPESDVAEPKTGKLSRFVNSDRITYSTPVFSNQKNDEVEVLKSRYGKPNVTKSKPVISQPSFLHSSNPAVGNLSSVRPLPPLPANPPSADRLSALANSSRPSSRSPTNSHSSQPDQVIGYDDVWNQTNANDFYESVGAERC